MVRNKCERLSVDVCICAFPGRIITSELLEKYCCRSFVGGVKAEFENLITILLNLSSDPGIKSVLGQKLHSEVSASS